MSASHGRVRPVLAGVAGRVEAGIHRNREGGSESPPEAATAAPSATRPRIDPGGQPSTIARPHTTGAASPAPGHPRETSARRVRRSPRHPKYRAPPQWSTACGHRQAMDRNPSGRGRGAVAAGQNGEDTRGRSDVTPVFVCRATTGWPSQRARTARGGRIMSCGMTGGGTSPATDRQRHLPIRTPQARHPPTRLLA